ncbi:unnamed protein product [Phaedon cochleariae]|uniref:Uncharacterized protein n=1 Tax=Phaedon cochleariae TaxID=80249 RepID=A0A9P0DMY3_PHACE|nr:unnamed protein product [Phaedon cochleariae]
MTDNACKARPKRYGLLSKVSLSELKTIRIAVKRSNITVQGPPTPIVRSIDDPKRIVPLVHIKTGNDTRPTSLFDREDVQVNQEERFVLADANRLDPDHSPSSKSSTRSRSRTPAGKSKSSTTTGRGNDGRRSRSRDRRSRSRDRRSRSRDRRSKSRERRSNSRERRSRGKEKRSRSRERRNDDKPGRETRIDSYSRPRRHSTDQDDRERRSKVGSIERRDNRRSEDRPTTRKSRSRDRSRDREKSNERYNSKKYDSRQRDDFVSRKRSPTPLRPGEYRPGHPDLKTRSRSRGRNDKIRSVSRRSRSPSRDRQQPSSSRRSRSPRYEKPSARRTSRSPRRSRSPAGYSGKKTSGDKRWSRSPVRHGERKKSRSPHSSPSKHARRSSRSPGRPHHHGRYRPPADPRSTRSRSPHPPVVTFNRQGAVSGRRRSRSPEYERDRRRQGRRSRSRSPARRADGYDYGFYEGIPGAEFWIPGTIRPSFPAVPRFYPPAFYPRGFPPGTPIILPPRYPMMYPPIRHRPVYNRTRFARPATETAISGVGENAVTSVASVASAGEVIVQEVVEGEKTEVGSESIEKQ